MAILSGETELALGTIRVKFMDLKSAWVVRVRCLTLIVPRAWEIGYTNPA